MRCFSGSSILAMVRRIVCLLCVFFLVAIALQGVTNVQKEGATVENSYSSSSSSSPPLPLEKNFLEPKLEGRTMGPKNSDTLRDIKRKVPNGPDPIHNRRAGKSRQTPGRQ